MGIKNVSGVAPLMQVFDMRKSVAWYCDVLGFELVHKHEPEGHLHWAMLKLGGAVVMLNSKYEPENQPAQPEPALGREDSTLYFGCDDVDRAYEEVRKKWNEVKEPKTAYYGMRQMYLTDPDGFVLCFQHPAKN